MLIYNYYIIFPKIRLKMWINNLTKNANSIKIPVWVNATFIHLLITENIFISINGETNTVFLVSI